MKRLFLKIVLSLGCIVSWLSSAAPDIQPVGQVSNVVLQPVTATSFSGQPAALAPASELPAGSTVLTPTIPSPESNELADIYLNFENSSLASIVNYLAERKKLNIIPHPTLEATMVTLSTRSPLTLERAWNVLLTLMEVNGFSIVKVGDIHRVVLSRDSGMEALPVYSSDKGVEPEDLPSTSLIIRYVYFFKSLKADLALQLLRTMLEGDNNTVIVNRDLNACIIKQESLNIKAAMKIVKILDDSGLQEAIRIVPLKHTNADVVAGIFNEILGAQPHQDRVIKFSVLSQQKETSFFNANTRVIAEPIKNSLILMGSEKHLDRITTFIKEKLDVPLDDAASRLHIKEVKYARAEAIKPILDNMIRPPSGQGVDRSSIVGEFKFFEDVIIAVEEQKDTQSGFGGGNRLIVACNREDWIRLDRIIAKLDTPQSQIALEVMVIDTAISKDSSLGAQMFNLKGRAPGMGVDTVSFNNLDSGVSSGANLPSDQPHNLMTIVENQGAGSPSFLTFGRPGTPDNPADNNLWGIIRATCNLENAHVITQPFMVANNYQPCSIKVDQERLVPGELVDGTRTGETRRRKVPINATTLIEITPKINRDGLVELTLSINLDDFADAGSADQPTITKRLIKTKLLMATGEVAALGGFLTKRDTMSEYKTPVLASIPILGLFFRSKKVVRQDRNVYVFIRPSIIKPEFEGAPDEYTQLKLDYAKYQSVAHDTYAKERDPIQRWFFKPRNQSVKQSLADAANSVYRPIDDFATGKVRPKTVNVRLDPYYKVSEGVEQERALQKKRALQRKTRTRVQAT